MKNKIIILTLVFIFAGSVVMGLSLVSLTPEEAYESAADNNIQFEIDALNLELSQMAHEKNLKKASIPALNNYYGQLSKYYTPFNSETSLIVKEAQNERAHKLLEIDVLTAAKNLENAQLAYDEADMAYSEALSAYNDAISDSTVSYTDELSLKYTMESCKISLHQSQNNLEAAHRRLDELVGQEGVSVILPNEYSSPYDINPDEAYESAFASDISIYQSMRSARAAEIKFEIADKFYDEDEETYISALAGLKSAELSYEKARTSLEIRVLDDINNLKNKYDSISLAELNKKIKLDEYNAAKTQFDAGILSAIQLGNSEDSYISAKKQLDGKIHDYILTSMRFTIDYGYEF